MRETLKRNSVRLVTYVLDNVLKPLINAIHADDYFTCFATTREEEAVGIVSGGWMAGLRGIAQSAWAADEDMFAEMMARALTEDGPWLIAVRIDDKPGVGATERDPVLITDRFMRGMGTKG